VNMTKRAAAGAMITSVWSEDETDRPSYATDCVPISRRKHSSNDAIALRHHPGRIFAIALSIFVTLGFVSYATYVHQWSELSALRHLGSRPVG
jgi:hypothetical protein